MDTPNTIDPDRELTDHEIEAIRREVGLKPAFIVAEDFCTGTWRVRAIWNSDRYETE